VAPASAAAGAIAGKTETIMNILVIDIGGTSVKFLATGASAPRKFPSGRKMTPAKMVEVIKEMTGDWKYEVVSIGYPGLVLHDRVVSEPRNLAGGWVGFDFGSAFGRPVKLINDAAMQALGSYDKGLMLFLGLGTGLGSALIVDGIVVPLELGHLSFKNGTFEDYVGVRGLKRYGRKKWEKYVAYFANRLMTAVHPDDVVFGGGNAKKLRALPAGSRAGQNANAFLGGIRMWNNTGDSEDRRDPHEP